MATKEGILIINGGKISYVNDNRDNHFTNLNLNQNSNKISSHSQMHSQSVLETVKFPSAYQNGGNTVSNRHTSFASSLTSAKNSYGVHQQQKAGKIWKKDSSKGTTANSSTLSLHITAYENSIEASSGGGGDKATTEKPKKWKKTVHQIFTAPTIATGFEFPRQQRGDVQKPEIMGYKASQKLFNPNAKTRASKRKAPTSAVPPVSKKSYSANEAVVHADDDDDDDDMISVGSEGSNISRRSSRIRRPPPAHSNFIRTDARKVSFRVDEFVPELDDEDSDEEEDDEEEDDEEEDDVEEDDVEEEDDEEKDDEEKDDEEKDDEEEDDEEKDDEEKDDEEEDDEDVETAIRRQNELWNYDPTDYVDRAAELSQDEPAEPVKKKRGRKKALVQELIQDGATEPAEPAEPVKKKRGRKKALVQELIQDGATEPAEPVKKKRGRKKAPPPPSLNNPDLFFVGKSKDVVFAASNLDVTSGTVLENATVNMPVFGLSRVIYDAFTEESEAIAEAKHYAKGNALKYGKASGRFIVYPTEPPARIIGENDDRIAELEEDNRNLRIRLRQTEDRLAIAERQLERHDRLLDDIATGRFVVPNLNSFVADEAEINPITSTSTTEMPPPSPAQQRIIALSDITDAPSWKWISEAAAKAIKDKHDKDSTFIRALFLNLFTDLEAFQLQLPEEKMLEFKKIVDLMISPPAAADAKKLALLVDSEVKYQRERLRTTITRPQGTAVAMVERAIPLIERNSVWVPLDENVKYDRLTEQQVRAWPLLYKKDQISDTMFAWKENPKPDKKSFWTYFIVTRDGLRIECSK